MSEFKMYPGSSKKVVFTCDSVKECDGKIILNNISNIVVGTTEKGSDLVGYQIDKTGVKKTKSFPIEL